LQQKKAGWKYRAAEALAGGATYKYTVDEYGQMQKTKVPVSGAHLAMAFAMEVLHTIAAGAAGAAEKKFVNIGPDPATLRDQQAKAQATEDYTRKASITETNLRQLTTARNIGKMDFDQNTTLDAQYKPLLDEINSQAPGVLGELHNYSDLKDHNFTAEHWIPAQTVPRMDPTTHQQAVDRNGVQLWDHLGYVIQPGLKLSKIFTPDDIKGFKEMGKTWADNDRLIDTPMELTTALNQKSQLVAWNAAKVNVGNFASIINEAKGNTTGNTTTPTTPTSGLTMPTIKDPTQAAIITEMAAKNNVPAPLIGGVLNHESHGDPNAVSQTGVKGVMQVTGPTAQAMGSTDPDPVRRSIENGTRYLAALLDPKKYPNLKGDTRLVLAAYSSGPGAVNSKGQIVDTHDPKTGKIQHTAAQTTRYANDISRNIGLGQGSATTPGTAQAGTAQAGAAQAGQQAPAPTGTQANSGEGAGQDGAAQAGQPFSVDVAKWAKTHPSTAADLDKFAPALVKSEAAGKGYLGALAALGESDPQAAGNITAMLGGMDNVQAHDSYLAAQKEQKTLDQKADEAQKSLDTKKQHEEQGILDRNSVLINSLVTGKDIDLSRIATMRAYDREIIVNEVLRRNPNYNPASIDRAIKLADDAASSEKTGSLGNSVKNVNTFYGHTGDAMDHINNLFNKVGARNWSDYSNKTMGWMNDHFGTDPEYQQWKVALNAAATDWQNLLNNQHALTESDKEVSERVANPNATFGNAVASLKEMARTGAIRTVPLNEQWKQTMNVNYPNLIQPQTIAALKKINDPITNEYLKDMESGGTLVNGMYGVGERGKRVGDLLGNQQQKSQPVQYAKASDGYAPQKGDQFITSKTSGKVIAYVTPEGARHNIAQVPQGR
jgi:hypothetical protein